MLGLEALDPEGDRDDGIKPDKEKVLNESAIHQLFLRIRHSVGGGGRSEQGADKSPNAVPIVKAERSNTWEHSVLFVLPPVKDQRPGAFEPEEGRLWVVRA